MSHAFAYSACLGFSCSLLGLLLLFFGLYHFWGILIWQFSVGLKLFSILCCFWHKTLKDIGTIYTRPIVWASIAQLVEREAVNLKVGRSKLP